MSANDPRDAARRASSAPEAAPRTTLQSPARGASSWLATPSGRAIAVLTLLVIALGAVLLFRETRGDTPAGVATAEPKEGEAGEHAGEGEHGDEEANRVTLTEASSAVAQIEVVPVQVGSAARVSPGLDVPGQVELDPSRIALVSPRTDGRIERLDAVEGDRVPAGRTVALLQAKDYLIAQSDLQQASRRAAAVAGGADAEGANAIVRAARQRLRLLGVPTAEIARLERGGEPRLFLPLVSPIAGVIMKAHVLAGQAVAAGEPVYTIADPSAVDVVAAVQEQSAPMVRVGQTATVSVAALPTLQLKGHVERLRGELNQETRTVQAVIHVSNTSGQLRPGMFASVRIAVPASASSRGQANSADSTERVVTIPETAVVTDGDKRYVFVRIAPFVFERRQVEISPIAPAGSSVGISDFVLVRGGVKPGEQVVSRGAFTLKSELAKAGLGEHGH